MKTPTLILVPLVFAAGVISVVLLQLAGVIQITSPSASHTAISQTGSISTAQDGNARVNQAGSDNTGESNAVLTQAKAELEQLNQNLSEDIADLRAQLQDATVQRDVLSGEIKQLAEQVDNAVENNAFLPSGEFSESVTGEAFTDANANDSRGQNGFRRRGGFGQPDSDEQYESLVSAGIDPAVAAEIKQRSDQWTLQRLELVDQASREGWRRSEEFEERMSALREERPDIRSELGDDDYDRYLFESGESNRVQIGSIIEGSAAQIAGVQVGDIVRSYAGQRIYTMRELQSATREGTRGESVSVFIERGSQQLALDVSRGPLGVTLSGLSVEPGGF